MRIMTIVFCGGALAFQFVPVMPSRRAFLALALSVAFAGLAAWWLHGRWPRIGRGVVWLVALAVGFLYAGWRADMRLSEALPIALEGQDVVVSGVVASLPQAFERGQRFVFDLDEGPQPLPGRISLAWYDGPADRVGPAAPVLHAGQRWRLTVRLKRPHGNLNPHGFDYEGWLLQQGIRATGYVRPDGERALLDPAVAAFGLAVERLREGVRDRFRQALPEGRYAGVLIALAIGDQRAIPAEQWRVFARTGISHLVAISGMHVTMIATLAALLVGAGWRRSPALALRWPAQQAGVMAGFVVAWGYCLLAGWGVPAQRTLYMLGCVSLALVLRRDVAPSRVLAAALGVVVVIDPWSVLAAGFWLSFGAVAVLLLVSAGRLGPGGRVLSALRTQWAVTLGLVPALLVLFQQFSLVSPLANGIAIPLISFVVTPLALLFALLPLQMFADLAHGAMVLTMLPVGWLGELPGAAWQQAAPPVLLAWLATACCLWALLPRGTPARLVGLLPLLALLLWSPERPPDGRARVTVLDVGQGLAVHVQTARHDLLYDTGPAFSSDANSGERILLPYLRAVGVHRLDALVVSHQDQDHAGGAESVLTGLPVARVLVSLPANHPLRLIAGPRGEACATGQAWEWDGVRFHVLHPGEAVDEGRAGNTATCVLQVEAAGRRVLLSSDIEAVSESQILAREGGTLASEFVLAPHHGSRTSSSAAFIAATAPRWVIFPVGYRNRFRHPAADVWARWGASGAGLLRTDLAGAVSFEVGPVVAEPVAERERAPRYWHGR
ncbi:MAG: DNA internalization-related competence protein ComEC/Rec2 [Zoogloea sp.]|nr:MAG: DNA internalization-related competence protein ComEC/Rec2 [Zoogloea sp.]